MGQLFVDWQQFGTVLVMSGPNLAELDPKLSPTVVTFSKTSRFSKFCKFQDFQRLFFPFKIRIGSNSAYLDLVDKKYVGDLYMSLRVISRVYSGIKKDLTKSKKVGYRKSPDSDIDLSSVLFRQLTHFIH